HDDNLNGSRAFLEVIAVFGDTVRDGRKATDLQSTLRLPNGSKCVMAKFMTESSPGIAILDVDITPSLPEMRLMISERWAHPRPKGQEGRLIQQKMQSTTVDQTKPFCNRSG